MTNVIEIKYQDSQGPLTIGLMLVLLVRKFDQVINTVIVGCQEVSKVPVLQPDIDLDTPSEIVLELIDSSVWRIYSKDERLLDHLQHEFSNVRQVEAMSVSC